MKTLILFLLLLAAPAFAAPPLIVISIDGFRADYLARGKTPTLAMLAKTGVHARAMRPSFPALTFPNHYTLVTGLRPDHHGIVDNVMWDESIGQKFTMSADTAFDPRWWNGAKPLWISADEQGRVTAMSGWPGSEIHIAGRGPTYLEPWRENRGADDAVTTILNWLVLPPKQRPQLSFLYFYEVDHEGHEHGPDSAELNTALVRVDKALAKLVAHLKARHLYDRTNIVIVSDHGMTATPEGQYTIIDQLVPPTEGIVRTWGSGSGIDALPGHEAQVAAVLLAPHDHFTCWRKSDLPVAFHYGANPRVPQFYCLNQPGWRFATAQDVADNKRQLPGNHGYDPGLPDMQALFVAHGPAFRKDVTLGMIDNVDVYPLLAAIAGLKPEKNDGEPGAFAGALSP